MKSVNIHIEFTSKVFTQVKRLPEAPVGSVVQRPPGLSPGLGPLCCVSPLSLSLILFPVISLRLSNQ